MATIDNVHKNPNYYIWSGMIQRINNKKNPLFKYYGGRGIHICKRWLKFKNFLKDMGERPNEKYSIDRINNNGHYCKNNCRWATQKEQLNNTRRNRIIKYRSKTKSISQWAEFFGIKSSTFRQRFYVYKWPFNRCIINK
jgi:hypothetical protein